MFSGVFYNIANNNESIADIGGHRILKMNGSLSNYINTGSAAPLEKTSDTFENSNSKNSKPKNKSIAGKIAAIAGAAATVVGGIVLYKKGGFSKINKAVKDKTPKVAEFFSGLKDKVSSLFKKKKA